MAAQHEEAGEHIDPFLTIAERVAREGAKSEGPLGADRDLTVKPYAIEAPLRGRTRPSRWFPWCLKRRVR